jgi:hypothetical protein
VSTPVENSPALGRWWFTVSAGQFNIGPAGEAETGNSSGY